MMREQVDPVLSRAIREDLAVAAAHARVEYLLPLVGQRQRGSKGQKAAIIALQVAVQRRRDAYNAWAAR